MTIELYIARHGRTVHNDKGIIQGQKEESELSELGLRQTFALGKQLANRGIELIISGTLNRQKQTTEQINKTLNVPVEYTDNLKERYFGWIEGKKISDLVLIIPDDEEELYLSDKGEHSLMGEAETHKEISERVDKVIKKILDSGKEVVATSASSWINQYMINHLLEESTTWHGQENASAHYFVLNNNGKVENYELNKVTVDVT